MSPDDRAELLKSLPGNDYHSRQQDFKPGAIAGFARDFWQLSPEERERLAAALALRLPEHGVLRSWLQRLKSITDVVLPDEGELKPAEAELLRHIATLAVAPLHERAMMRRQFVLSCTSRWMEMRDAAGGLRRNHPAVARLAPELLDDLVQAKADLVVVTADDRLCRPAHGVADLFITWPRKPLSEREAPGWAYVVAALLLGLWVYLARKPDPRDGVQYYSPPPISNKSLP
ncbi:MAG: hypothetical protein K1X57_12230 [Gemmataceae bacterium]|nr:hypothetical protein [Gemmataceae bacterium]